MPELVQEKQLKRFMGHYDAEKKAFSKILEFRKHIELNTNALKSPDSKLLTRFRISFSKEKKRVEKAMDSLGDDHYDNLERECFKEHLELVDGALSDAKSLLNVKGKEREKFLKKLNEKGVPKEDPNNRRSVIADILNITPEPEIMSNQYVINAVEGKIIAFNDTNLDDDELKKVLESSSWNVKADVQSFKDHAERLIDHIKNEVKPDLIILPMRGGHIFTGMFPKKFRNKIHKYEVSEHLPKHDRFKAISKLVNKLLASSSKKIAWLDDEIFTGLQSGTTHNLLKKFAPDRDIEFHALALAAFSPEPEHYTGNMFTATQGKLSKEDVERINNNVHKDEKLPLPMLASKWLMFFLSPKSAEDAEEERHFIGPLKQSRKKGMAGKP